MSKVTAILLGGGKGARMEGQVEDKILMMIQGKPLFGYSIEAFIASEVVDSVMIVYRDIRQGNAIEEWIYENIANPPEMYWTKGGERRQDSVLAGLRALGEETGYVFIHDLARPLVRAESIKKVYEVLLKEGAAVLGHPVIDTIKQISSKSLKILDDLDRKTLWAMETPQAFKYSLICEAYEEVEKGDLQITDDVAALGVTGHPVVIVENEFPNPKVTLKSDIDYFEFLLTRKEYAAAI